MSKPRPPADTSWIRMEGGGQMLNRRGDREQSPMTWIKAHLKAIAAFAGFVAAAIVGVTDGGINGVVEWTVVLVALANAVNVYITPNLVGGAGKFAKEISAAVIAVGAALPLALEGGLDSNEWVMLICLVLGAFGVVLPNVDYRFATKQHKTITGQPR